MNSVLLSSNMTKCSSRIKDEENKAQRSWDFAHLLLLNVECLQGWSLNLAQLSILT